MELGTRTSEPESSKSEMAVLSQEKTALTETMAKLRSDLEAESSLVTVLNANLTEARNELSARHHEMDSLSDDLHTSKTTSDTLRLEITVLTNTSTNLRTELDAEHSRLVNLSNDMRVRQTELDEVHADFASEKVSSANLRTELEAERSKVIDLSNKLATASTAETQPIAKTANAWAELNLASATDYATRLQSELETAKTEIALLRESQTPARKVPRASPVGAQLYINESTSRTHSGLLSLVLESGEGSSSTSASVQTTTLIPDKNFDTDTPDDYSTSGCGLHILTGCESIGPGSTTLGYEPNADNASPFTIDDNRSVLEERNFEEVSAIDNAQHVFTFSKPTSLHISSSFQASPSSSSMPKQSEFVTPIAHGADLDVPQPCPTNIPVQHSSELVITGVGLMSPHTHVNIGRGHARVDVVAPFHSHYFAVASGGAIHNAATAATRSPATLARAALVIPAPIVDQAHHVAFAGPVSVVLPRAQRHHQLREDQRQLVHIAAQALGISLPAKDMHLTHDAIDAAIELAEMKINCVRQTPRPSLVVSAQLQNFFNEIHRQSSTSTLTKLHMFALVLLTNTKSGAVEAFNVVPQGPIRMKRGEGTLLSLARSLADAPFNYHFPD